MEIVDEAEEIKPPYKLESPFANKVEEALNGPLTLRMLEKVEEAVERRPDKVESPLALNTLADKVEEELKTPLTNKLLEKVEEALDINPFIKLASLPNEEVLETVNCEVEALPVTVK